MIISKHSTSVRQISAIFITPVITGLLIASCLLLLWQENSNKTVFTITFTTGMTFALGLLLGLPPYLWLRWKKSYSRTAIIKVGIVIGGIIGLNITIFTDQFRFIIFGMAFGFIGSLIFHEIHGVIDYQKKTKSEQQYLILKFLIAFFLIISSFIVYRNFAVDFHVQAQSEIICDWLNSHSATKKPSVGPLAHKKLEYLKNKYSGGFECRIEEPLPSLAKYYEKAIVIYHDKTNKLGLHYEFGGGIRQAFIAHYSHLWTPKDSDEDEYNNF